MREQLRLLEELQRHDMRLQELDSARKALPEKVAEAEATIVELEKLLQREHTELAETEAFQKEQERQQREAEAQLQKAKAKQNQVRNTKESDASQRELDGGRKSIESRTEDLSKLSQVLAEQRSKIKEHEDKLATEQRELVAQQAVVAERLAKLEQDITAAKATREEAAGALRPDALRKYNVIVQRRRGTAVVPVHNGTCRGCNMNIPPQLYNTIQRGNSLELCPNCNRIIYWGKLLDAGDESPGQGAGKAHG